MKVILEIPDDKLERLGELAKFQKRSRKAFMELVLINHAECAEDGVPEPKLNTSELPSENKAIVAPISVRDAESHDPDKKIAPIQRKTTPAVNIQNFTNDQNTNKVVKVEGEPQRQPGEDAIDFAIRKNEWKLKNQQQ